MNAPSFSGNPEARCVLALFASPRAEGRTAQMLDAFLRPLRDAGAETAVVNVYAVNPRPCTGCGACKTREGCVFPDLDFLDALYRRADAVIVASPVYNLTFPAPMKAVLDRAQRYFEARFSLGIKPPIARPKQAVLLAVGGNAESAEDGAAIMERQLKMTFSVMNTTWKKPVVWMNTDSAGKAEEREARTRAEASGLAMCRDLW